MDVVNRLVQAQAHAEAQAFPTTLKLWRDGVAVEMWRGGWRIEKRATWSQVDLGSVNVPMQLIDECAAELARREV